MTDNTITRQRKKLDLSDDARRSTLLMIGLVLVIIGAVAFSLSFMSVMRAAEPHFGRASWAVPTLLDLTIAAMTATGIVLELNELPARGARLFSRVLVAYTVWANAQDATTWAGRCWHCLPPVAWVGVVTIMESAVRRLVGLTSDTRMDKVRPVRWLLAPASTLRLWRRMRLWEITSYREAVAREHTLTASRALLRQWYGRAWRGKAPRGERLAVALQGSSDRPVADVLTEASAGILAAAAAAAKPVADTAQTPPEAAEDSAPRFVEPVLYPGRERIVLSPFSTANAPRFPFSPGVNALPSARAPQPSQNAAANAENDRDAAVRMRAEGLSIGVIADRLGRSKSWVHGVVGPAPVEHVNGSGQG